MRTIGKSIITSIYTFLINHRYSIIAILSTCLLISIFNYLYTLLQAHDWGQAFTKLLCFSAFFSLLFVIYKSKCRISFGGEMAYKLESLLALLVLIFIIFIISPKYLTQLQDGPRVDIGYTTQNSAIMLFRDGKNPYMSETINVRNELKPEHRGFHYGPGMLIGYVGSFIAPNVGYKISNLIFLLGTIVALVVLIDGARETNANIWHRFSDGCIVIGLFLLPERLWYEVFAQGANDIFPIMLLLVGLVFVQKGFLLWAGGAMGFSFVTKFSPAVFLLVLFLRRDISMKFLIGCTVGTLPLMVFLVWDFKSVVENVFILRFNLGYDSTSLYSITPRALHYIFPLIQVLAVLYFLKKNMNKHLGVDALIFCFTSLLIIIEVTFKEIHANHLIWFYPLFAYLAARYRHRLLPQLVSNKRLAI